MPNSRRYLTREQIEGYRTLCVADIGILCDMAIASLRSETVPPAVTPKEWKALIEAAREEGRIAGALEILKAAPSAGRLPTAADFSEKAAEALRRHPGGLTQSSDKHGGLADRIERAIDPEHCNYGQAEHFSTTDSVPRIIVSLRASAWRQVIKALRSSVAAPNDDLAKAVRAYDRAIRACANDPAKMASFCSAEGEDLDTLYFAMVNLAHRPTPQSATAPTLTKGELQALIDHHDWNDAGADAIGMVESAEYHSKRSKLFADMLSAYVPEKS